MSAVIPDAWKCLTAIHGLQNIDTNTNVTTAVSVPQMGVLSLYQDLNQHRPSVSHGDELGYLFRIGILPEIPLNRDSPEKIHQRELLKLWGNFIHTGNPNAEGTDPGKRWTPAWQDATMQYMDLGQEFRMRREPINERVFFWDALYRNTLDRPLAS